MPPRPIDYQYALKLGEIHLRSKEPITEEQRREALKHLVRVRRKLLTVDGLLISDIMQTNER